MSGIIFAQKSKGPVSIEDFKPLVETPVEPKVKERVDLIFKQGNFVISPNFLEGQSLTQGWNVGIDPTTNKAYLFRNIEASLFPRVKFLKGDKPFPRFKSESIDIALTAVSLDKNSPLYLVKTEGVVEGFEAFLITDVNPDATPSQEDVTTMDTSAPIMEAPVVEQEQAVTRDISAEVDELLA